MSFLQSSTGCDGYAPLHLCAISNALDDETSVRIAQVLLEKGADKEIATRTGDTASSLAAARGKRSLVQLPDAGVMNDRVADLLSQVRVLERKYERVSEAPASLEQIGALREAVRVGLGADLPDEYARFLALSNGIDWNGTVFYATERRSKTPARPFMDGMVPANLEIRDKEAFHRLLVLGESGMELYVRDLASGTFRIVDRVSLDIYESYESFDELFVAAIKKRLILMAGNDQGRDS